MSRKVRVIDTTMRDGSHAIDHQYTKEIVAQIAKGADEAGVYCIEVGHGAGIGGSVLQYGLEKESTIELIRTAKSMCKKTKVGTLLVPGLGTMEDLKEAHAAGLDLVRVAVHCTEADVGAQHVRLAKSLGLEAIMFFMMTHMVTPEELAQQASMAESYGADVVYFADSSGAMTLEDIRQRVKAIKEKVSIPVGVHAHNNLGLGVGNSIAGIEAGCDYVDGTFEGLGAGCGNANIQGVVAVLNKMGIETGVDLYKLIEVGKNVVRPIIKHSLEITGEAILLGYIGIYSSFYLHVIEYAEKFQIEPKLIFEELGRRKVVGGQEDQILDICHEIIEKKEGK